MARTPAIFETGLSVVITATTQGYFLDGPAGVVKSVCTVRRGGVLAWRIAVEDATDDYRIRSYDNIGNPIDVPLTIVRASGGAITLTRPTTFTGQITSTVTTGTAPFVIASTTNVPNLNASSLNGATFAAPGAIGSGTPGTGAFTTLSATGALTVARGTITSGVAIDGTATWNSGATTFLGMRFVATNTASSADSRLLELTLGSTIQFSVLRDGIMTFTSSATTWPSSTYDAAGVILRTSGGGSAPFDQAGSLLYRARLSNDAGRSSHIFYTGASATERLRINEAGAVIVAAGGVLRLSGTTATWSSGTGTPEGAVTAPVGSVFTRTDGGAATTLYVKESGSGNTGWVAK
jgi:hypothetical protein